MPDSKQAQIEKLAHSINTPLTTILGYMSLIKKKSQDAEVVSWAESINAEVLKISKYSKEITDLVTKQLP